jgi:hypothetical protein
VSVIEGIHLPLQKAAAKVSVSPNPNGLPGLDVAQKLVNGIAAAVMLACLFAFLWGAGQWGLGTKSHNYGQASDGKGRMLAGLAGAFAVGAAAAVINFFFSAGAEVSGK